MSYDPVYCIAKPCITCGVCQRERRFCFVVAVWHEPVLVQGRKGPRWEHQHRTMSICSPSCAENFASYNEAPMYDRWGVNIYAWLKTWREERRAA